MANTFLTRTPSSAGNRQTWTISAWIKRGTLGTYQNIVCSRSDANNALHLAFDDEDRLFYQHYLGGSVLGELKTNRRFKDTNAWYNVVVTLDSTNGTAGDRQKMFINGVEETVFDTDTNLSQNQTSDWNDISNPMYIGQGGNSNNYWTGSMSYVAFIDGTAEAPGIFGETDATTGEWKIKTAISPSSAWGTNGFLVLKDGNSVTDQSTNSNNFTVGAGTLTKTEDCPSNVFCTINPLDNYYPNSTMTHGNTRITTANANRSYNTGTLGASSGKYYWEVKMVSNVTSGGGTYIGIASTNPNNDGSSSAQTLGYKQYDYSYSNSNGNLYTDNSASSYANTYGDNDIMGVAMDLDNNKLYFAKNGTWQNSGDPTSGSTGTGAISIQAASDTVNGFYTPGLGDWWTSGFTVSFNFGNGYLGGTAVSSAGTNASGLGIFEYDVPAGYTALCTKGLNE